MWYGIIIMQENERTLLFIEDNVLKYLGAKCYDTCNLISNVVAKCIRFH